MKDIRIKDTCEQFISEAMELNDLPGLVIGVSAGGEEWTGAWGVRDLVTGDPLQADDVFHCASVSKLFTASAVMQLVDQGRLDLNERLCGILPDLRIADRRYEEIRLYQMLSHTAGIGDVDDYRWEEALTAQTALSDYVHSAEVTDLPLLWEPGKGGFRYSNIAYEILGHIVSVKSGMSYEDYVRENLMAPAQMTHSTMLTFERIGAKAGRSCPLITEEIRKQKLPMALPHEKAADRTIVPVTYYPYTRAHGPSSTLTSTASDLLKWARMHMSGFAAAEREGRPEAEGPSAEEQTGGLLSPESYQHMSYEYAEVPNNREKMGLGWFMRRQCGCRLYGHEGTDDGFRASLWICPEKETAICVLSNLSGAPVKKLNKKLFERLMDRGL